MDRELMLKGAFIALQRIEDCSGNAIKEVLRDNYDNEILKEMFIMALDPYTTYGVKKFSVPTKVKRSDVSLDNYIEFKKLLKLLEKRELTGNAALAKIKKFFGNCNSVEIKWYSKILQMDLKIGASVKTINSVYKGLINEFEVMAAEGLYENKRGEIISNEHRIAGKQVIVEDKVDGIRCYAFKYSPDNIVLTSRNGRELFGYEHLIEQIKKDTYGYGYIIDGELQSEQSFNKTISTVSKKETGKRSVLNIFDTLPIENFLKNEPYRKTTLERKLELLDKIGENKYLNLLPFEGPFEFDIDKVNELYEDALSRGLEGVMIKDADAFYYFDRTYDWLKLKPVETYDAPIIGYKEGTGRNKGKLGAFIVDFEGEELRVGGGFSDAERDEFWNKRDKMIGVVIEFMCNGKTTNKRGTSSARFGRFKKIRYDKTK